MVNAAAIQENAAAGAEEEIRWEELLHILKAHAGSQRAAGAANVQVMPVCSDRDNVLRLQ